MKTDTPRPILLKDYRPSNYLIDTVNLDVALHPTRTRVRSRLKVRANPVRGKARRAQARRRAAGAGAVRLDGGSSTPGEYKTTDKELIIARAAEGRVHARDHDVLQPARPTRR